MEESIIMERLKEKNEYFKRMANLIPAQFYYEQETKQVVGGKYFKNIEGKAPSQKRKAMSKGAKKLKRLDPSQHKTVTDIQNEMVTGDDKDSSDESEDEGVHSGDDGAQSEDSASDGESHIKRKKVKGQPVQPVNVEKVRTGTSLDELRDKLQKRINELRLKRRAPTNEDSAVIPRKMSKKMREAERKKKEKMEAIQASKKKLQDAMRSKAKLRETDEGGGPKADTNTPQKEEVAFSKFAFEEYDAAKEHTMRKKKKKHDEPRSSRDYGRLLKKAEKHKEKLTNLKEKDPEKAQQMMTDDKWKKALSKAQGVKIKDDPELLKKSIRREHAKKKRSKKEWKAREKHTEKLVKSKQSKRQKNIQDRKNTKKSKKVKILQNKGKLLLQD